MKRRFERYSVGCPGHTIVTGIFACPDSSQPVTDAYTPHREGIRSMPASLLNVPMKTSKPIGHGGPILDAKR